MTSSEQARTAACNVGITIYGCEQDEAVLFREMAPRLGVRPTITAAALAETNVDLALGNRCSAFSSAPLPSHRPSGNRTVHKYTSSRNEASNVQPARRPLPDQISAFQIWRGPRGSVLGMRTNPPVSTGAI